MITLRKHAPQCSNNTTLSLLCSHAQSALTKQTKKWAVSATISVLIAFSMLVNTSLEKTQAVATQKQSQSQDFLNSSLTTKIPLTSMFPETQIST